MKQFFISIIFFLSLNLCAEESLLFEILKKGTLDVSVGADYEPYYIADPKPDYPGFEVEIAQLYADFLGVKLNKVLPMMNFTEHVKAINSGKVDMALGNSANLARMKLVYFSDSYISVSAAALVNKNLVPSETDGDVILNRTFRSLSDISTLTRLNIGVKDKTSNLEYLKKNYSQFPITAFPNDVLALEALKENKINCYVADNLYIEGLLQKDSSLRARFIPLLNPVMDKQLSFAFKKYDIQLMHSINLFIREIKRTGEINQLKSKYFNSNLWVKDK